ncbi:MAG: DUF84 family protein [Alphaproteobacteria bacterium]|nr:DUF84 family protein [Alphaproteobacteria bacterium]
MGELKQSYNTASLIASVQSAATSSRKAKKLYAAQAVFPSAILLSDSFNSGVSELPYKTQTIRGAWNRLVACKAAFPDADAWLSTEGGAFDRNDSQNNYLEQPFNFIEFKTGEIGWALGEGILYPHSCVHTTYPDYPHVPALTNDYSIDDALCKLALHRGIEIPGEGTILPKGTVVDPHDVHLTLVGKTRTQIIHETYMKALDNIEETTRLAKHGNPADIAIRQLGL